ncbi:hypothetical protein WME91_02455 [Sorangium sp. So ce269]
MEAERSSADPAARLLEVARSIELANGACASLRDVLLRRVAAALRESRGDASELEGQPPASGSIAENPELDRRVRRLQSPDCCGDLRLRVRQPIVYVIRPLRRYMRKEHDVSG